MDVTINDIAAVIRQYPNTSDADTLGKAIAAHLDGSDCDGCAQVVADIIRKVNPERTMGAGRLAEHILDELDN